VGILHRSFLCIDDSRVRVHSQISWPAPHSVSRCSVVSCFPHRGQASVSTKRIVCNMACVGRTLWTTIYQADLAPSDVLLLWRLFHALAPSNPGRSCITRTSRGVHSAVFIIRRVQYTRLVNALCDSSCLLGVIYAHANA